MYGDNDYGLGELIRLPEEQLCWLKKGNRPVAGCFLPASVASGQGAIVPGLVNRRVHAMKARWIQ